LVQAAATSAAFKPSMNRLAPHPQFQGLRLFVHFVPVHPVTRPRQNRRPFFIRQLLSVPKNAISLNHRHFGVFTNSCGEPIFEVFCSISLDKSFWLRYAELDEWQP